MAESSSEISLVSLRSMCADEEAVDAKLKSVPIGRSPDWPGMGEVLRNKKNSTTMTGVS